MAWEYIRIWWGVDFMDRMSVRLHWAIIKMDWEVVGLHCAQENVDRMSVWWCWANNKMDWGFVWLYWVFRKMIRVESFSYWLYDSKLRVLLIIHLIRNSIAVITCHLFTLSSLTKSHKPYVLTSPAQFAARVYQFAPLIDK